QPPERLRGEHERRDPDRSRWLLQMAMRGPQGPKGMLAAATHVLFECLQSTLVRFCGPMAVFRGHIVEPPCCGFCNFIVKLELARYRMFRVSGSRMMGGMGASNNRRGRIATGHRTPHRFFASGRTPARRRTARFITPA